MPPLLISTSFTVDSYKIYLTDLAHLWCEDLDRRSILRRSLAEDTSIDPSEDAGQLKLFLDKISLGLEGGKDVDLLLGLDTHAAKESSTGARNLELNLSIALPKPVQPLNWTIKLSSCPQSDFATHFTIPLLCAQNARLKELDSLVSMLRDKDNVIQKLVDMLEATGAELGHLFPGVAGKGGRKIPRRVVEEKVKGLEAFSQEQWRNAMRNVEAENEHVDVKTIVQGAFTKNSSVGSLSHAAELPARFDKWWEQLTDGAINLSTPQDGGQEADTGVKVETTEADMDTTEDEGTEGNTDDFQVAATPPRQQVLSSRAKASKSSPLHKPTRKQELTDDGTDDSDDLGASQSQHAVIRDSFPAPKEEARPATKKIGAIGGVKKASKTATKMKPEPESEPEPEPEPEPESEPEHVTRSTRSHKQDDVDGNETETEDEGTNAPSKPTTPQKKSPPKPAAKAAKKGGLGKIGGKKNDPPPAPASPSKEDAPAAPKSEPPTKATKSKLGRIGHKPSKDEAGADEDLRGRTEAKEEEKPRETSEERAQRKREELKRQLEEKAKAPAKKKRKF
ncbi:hypothetical protein V490_01102 [Pseudogymnoascus sp. VKM F-3557]|nr:hypothetical protein V490_01102 [Pseudogymnoascus sp. VKM F-3557]